MRLPAATAVAVLLLGVPGCGTAPEIPAVPTPNGTASWTASPAAAPSAQRIVDAFIAAGLPAGHPRDDSDTCSARGCTALVTTDSVSVYVWPDPAGARTYAQTLGNRGFTLGPIVLSYAAGTPAGDQPRYESVLRQTGG